MLVSDSKDEKDVEMEGVESIEEENDDKQKDASSLVSDTEDIKEITPTEKPKGSSSCASGSKINMSISISDLILNMSEGTMNSCVDNIVKFLYNDISTKGGGSVDPVISYENPNAIIMSHDEKPNSDAQQQSVNGNEKPPVGDDNSLCSTSK